jgi:transposase-like protein
MQIQKGYHPQKDEVLRRYEAGDKISAISGDLGVSPQLIRFWARKAGIWKNVRKDLSGLKSKALDLVGTGLTLSEIAKSVGTSDDNVRNWFKAEKVDLGSVKDGSRKYTEDQKSEVLRLRKEGLEVQEISERTGVSPGSVRSFCSKNGVRLSSEQKGRIHSLHVPAEVVLQIVESRKAGKTVKSIMRDTGLRKSKIKDILSEHGVILDMETRQANARSGQAPDHMDRMRAGLTPESETKRLQTLKKFWSDPAPREAARKRIQEFWKNLSPEDWIRVNQKRPRGRSSYAFQRSLGEEKTSSDRFRAYAESLGGKYRGPLSEWIAVHERVDWECQKGHRWSAQATSVVNGYSWCPQCSRVGPSKGQIEVADFVKSLGLEVEISTRSVISPMEIDVWIPSRKMAIEFNGTYWHSTKANSEIGIRHFRKWNLLDRLEIPLFALFSDEWEKKRDLVKTMLIQRLGLSTAERVNARACDIKELTPDQTSKFFDEYHLDGSGGRHKGLGLYHNGVLVQAISLKRNFNHELEVARLATHTSYMVRGGASKLIASVHERPLVSFSNNRLSRGDVYQKLGFIRKSVNRPSYWYTDGSDVRIWRWKCKRNNDPDILSKYPTEDEQAQNGVFSPQFFGDNRPLFKIYDYGHQKWVLL